MDQIEQDPVDQRPSHARYVVLVWLCSAATIAYVCRNSISVAETTIRKELNAINVLGFTLSPREQMGWVMSAFFITYALFQLPTGWLGHRLGTRRGLPVFSIVWSIFTAGMGLATGFVTLLLARLGSGVAQAGIFPCCAVTNSKWFPITGRGLANGALASFMSLGGALGGFVTGRLLGLFSDESFLAFYREQSWLSNTLGPPNWRWVFVLFSIPGIIWAVWFYRWFRDYPDEHRSVNAAELDLIQGDGPAPRSEREPTPWRMILTSRAMWWICGQQFFRAAGYIFFATWFATYLQETRGVDIEEAGDLSIWPLLAVVIGSPAGGLIADRIMARTGSLRLSRQVFAAVCLTLCGILVLASYPIHQAWLAVSVISIGAFFSAMAGPAGYNITIDMGGKHIAMVFSMMNMAGNIGAVLFPIVAARLVVITENWDIVLFMFAGFYFAAAICWACLNPHGKIVED